MKRLFLTFGILFSLLINAQNIPDKPQPARFVNDYAHLLNSSQIQQIEQALISFDQQTSTQIVLVTVNDFDGTSASDFAYQLGEKWGVGTKENNNGIVILVKPKTRGSKGEAFIATGYGLEGALPDITCSHIVNNEMIPYFRQGDYYRGLCAGTQAVMDATRGEYTATGGHKGGIFGSVFGLIILIIIISILMPVLPSFFPFLMLFSGWNSFTHSSGSFRGGSSFGGSFGGGSFGGGGGGGSW